MSATTQSDLNIEEQLGRIRRAAVESDKFAAETRKLLAEAAKLTRDRSMAPWQIVVSAMAAGGALVGGTVALMKILG